MRVVVQFAARGSNRLKFTSQHSRETAKIWGRMYLAAATVRAPIKTAKTFILNCSFEKIEGWILMCYMISQGTVKMAGLERFLIATNIQTKGSLKLTANVKCESDMTRLSNKRIIERGVASIWKVP